MGSRLLSHLANEVLNTTFPVESHSHQHSPTTIVIQSPVIPQPSYSNPQFNVVAPNTPPQYSHNNFGFKAPEIQVQTELPPPPPYDPKISQQNFSNVYASHSDLFPPIPTPNSSLNSNQSESGINHYEEVSIENPENPHFFLTEVKLCGLSPIYSIKLELSEDDDATAPPEGSPSVLKITQREGLLCTSTKRSTIKLDAITGYEISSNFFKKTLAISIITMLFLLFLLEIFIDFTILWPALIMVIPSYMLILAIYLVTAKWTICKVFVQSHPVVSLTVSPNDEQNLIRFFRKMVLPNNQIEIDRA